MKTINLTLFGEPILVLNSKQEWINKVPRHLPKERKAEVRLWVDKFGAVLSIGEDFMVAEKAETYPVTVYSLTRVAEVVRDDSNEAPL